MRSSVGGEGTEVEEKGRKEREVNEEKDDGII